MPAISVLKLDAEIFPPTERGCHKRTAAAREGVKYKCFRPREGFDEGDQNADGLLCRMCSVPGVLPRLNVLNRVIWHWGEALSQEIRLLMMRAQESAPRLVALVPDDVSHNAEVGLGPRAEEGGATPPSVERHAERVGLEYSIDIDERPENALGVAVIGNRAPTAIAIPNEVRWVGNHEIDTVARKRLQDLRAVSVDDLVRDEPVGCSLGCVVGPVSNSEVVEFIATVSVRIAGGIACALPRTRRSRAVKSASVRARLHRRSI